MSKIFHITAAENAESFMRTRLGQIDRQSIVQIDWHTESCRNGTFYDDLPGSVSKSCDHFIGVVASWYGFHGQVTS